MISSAAVHPQITRTPRQSPAAPPRPLLLHRQSLRKSTQAPRLSVFAASYLDSHHPVDLTDLQQIVITDQLIPRFVFQKEKSSGRTTKPRADSRFQTRATRLALYGACR